MTDYQKRFYYFLEQDSEDKIAMKDTLEPDTDPAAFDVDTAPTDSTSVDLAKQAAHIKTQQALDMQNTLSGWIDKLDEFLIFLNGTDSMSIQSKLATAEADTLFDRMRQSEQRKIARVATVLASLTESFRGYIAQSDNPQLKNV